MELDRTKDQETKETINTNIIHENEIDYKESEHEKREWRLRKAIFFTQEDDSTEKCYSNQSDHKVPDNNTINDLLYSDENHEMYEFTQFTQTQPEKMKSSQDGEDEHHHSVNHMLSELMASQACWAAQYNESESESQEDEEESVVPQFKQTNFPKETERSKNIFLFSLFGFQSDITLEKFLINRHNHQV